MRSLSSHWRFVLIVVALAGVTIMSIGVLNTPRTADEDPNRVKRLYKGLETINYQVDLDIQSNSSIIEAEVQLIEGDTVLVIWLQEGANEGIAIGEVFSSEVLGFSDAVLVVDRDGNTLQPKRPLAPSK